MANQLGERIRYFRKKKGLLLRQLAAALEIDTALLSKMERGARPVKKEQIFTIAKMLKAQEKELLTLYLADQVMDVLKDESLADEALKTVSEKLKKN